MRNLFTILGVSLLASSSAFAHCGSCDAKKCDKEGAACEKSCDKEGAACEKSCDKEATACATACDKENAVAAREYVVTGMTCDGCSKGLTKTLTAIDGVESASVCHKSGHASIVADNEKVSDEVLISAITEGGYQVTGELVKVSLCEKACSSCPTSLETKLAAMKGVKSVEHVCTESGSATLVIDHKETSREAVIAAMAVEEPAEG